MSKLRSGYTTGSCAAIAAKAAARMLNFNKKVTHEGIITPNGTRLYVPIEEAQLGDGYALCAVRKDAGDDPDVTDKLLIFAKVELDGGSDILIDGGVGIGRVTKKGLPCEVGEAAINPVPKRMIREAVLEIFEECGYTGGAKVTIYAPEGEKIALKTFNPRLGIEGGISIIGTTGIVEPMSERALIDTIRADMSVKAANGTKRLIMVPGNYGADFLEKELKIKAEEAVVISNYVGLAFDMALEFDFESILFVGHIGKLVKIAAGIMDTHSHMADGRMEVLGVHGAMNGARPETVRAIMECVSTDEAIRILKEEGCLKTTMDSIMKKINFHIKERIKREMPVEIIVFSLVHGILGRIK